MFSKQSYWDFVLASNFASKINLAGKLGPSLYKILPCTADLS